MKIKRIISRGDQRWVCMECNIGLLESGPNLRHPDKAGFYPLVPNKCPLAGAVVKNPDVLDLEEVGER